MPSCFRDHLLDNQGFLYMPLPVLVALFGLRDGTKSAQQLRVKRYINIYIYIYLDESRQNLYHGNMVLSPFPSIYSINQVVWDSRYKSP